MSWQPSINRRAAALSLVVTLALPVAPGLLPAEEGAGSQPAPQGPGPAPGPQAAPLGVTPFSPMTTAPGAVGVVPAIAVSSERAPLPSTTNLGGPVSTLGPYTLGPDDVVSIDVRGQPEFSGQFVVGHDGAIQYGIVGDVKADGLTKDELGQAIAERLQQYVRFPAVNVTITAFNSQAIYIFGQVNSPGKYAMRGDTIKIRDALVAAGLEGEYPALGRVKVIKTDPTSPTSRHVNVKRVIYQGETAQDIDLVNGDVVVVPVSVWGYFALFVRNIFGPVIRVARFATGI